MLLISLAVFPFAGCDDGGNKDHEPPKDTLDTLLVFDTLPPEDTGPGLDLPKGWTTKKDLHKEE